MQPLEPNLPGIEPNRATVKDLDFSSYRSIEEKVARGVASGLVRVLYTDIDATLVVGAGHTEAEVTKSHSDARKLIDHLNISDTVVIPITGSHFNSTTKTTNSILKRIETGTLPRTGDEWRHEPYRVDAYVTDGGARAVKSQNGDQIVDDDCYHQRVAPQDLNYDVVLAQATALASSIELLNLAPLNWEIIRNYDLNVDAAESRMFFQAGTGEGWHRDANKVALYFYTNNLADRDLIETKFNKVFEELVLKVICCEEKDVNTHARRIYPEANQEEGFPLKYCLDIVPYSKASAIEYFHSYISKVISQEAIAQGVSRPQLEVWASGDSGNDLPLLGSPMVTHVVIVGGASAELTRSSKRLEELGKKVYLELDNSTLGPASILRAFVDHESHQHSA